VSVTRVNQTIPIYNEIAGFPLAATPEPVSHWVCGLDDKKLANAVEELSKAKDKILEESKYIPLGRDKSNKYLGVYIHLQQVDKKIFVLVVEGRVAEAGQNIGKPIRVIMPVMLKNGKIILPNTPSKPFCQKGADIDYAPPPLAPKPRIVPRQRIERA
jgi:hypothetical protein